MVYAAVGWMQICCMESGEKHLFCWVETIDASDNIHIAEAHVGQVVLHIEQPISNLPRLVFSKYAQKKCSTFASSFCSLLLLLLPNVCTTFKMQQ